MESNSQLSAMIWLTNVLSDTLICLLNKVYFQIYSKYDILSLSTQKVTSSIIITTDNFRISKFLKIYAHLSSKPSQEKYFLFLLSIWVPKWILNFNHALTSLTELIKKALDEDKFT